MLESKHWYILYHIQALGKIPVDPTSGECCNVQCMCIRVSLSTCVSATNLRTALDINNKVNLIYRICGNFCLIKISPMVRALYCNKNLTDFNFSKCMYYPTGRGELFTIGENFAKKIIYHQWHIQHWRKFPRIRSFITLLYM